MLSIIEIGFVRKSPLVTQISWGAMDVEDLGHGKDMKLWPGGGREWDWRETDTHHVPGIQVADARNLLTATHESSY